MKVRMARTSWGIGLALVLASGAAGAWPRGEGKEFERGYLLFVHEWEPHDRMSRAGDGLGPMFNERSCVGCHNQGGPGGGGPLANNVVMVARLTSDTPAWLEKELAKIHPSLRTSRSVIVHRFGVDPRYERWRTELLASVPAYRDGMFFKFYGPEGVRSETITLRLAQRNTPPVFGSGLIDRIPDATIEAAAKEQFPQFPRLSGRAAHVPSGHVGRFGWKAQIATLDDFVLSACAGELGLEVPEHHQSQDPLSPGEESAGLDLSAADCRDLVAYVGSLPAPDVTRTRSFGTAKRQSVGEQVFHEIGCAACHRPALGEVEGLYSDLLLHDMGQSLSDPSQYYGSPGQPGSSEIAKAEEWRTPPLWGLRDSAPYLHDGRATTIERAIGFHEGEAADSARLFAKLTKSDQQALHTFLSSLEAPAPRRE